MQNGPASQPLRHLALNLNPDGQVVVDRVANRWLQKRVWGRTADGLFMASALEREPLMAHKRPNFFYHLHPPTLPAREARFAYTFGLGGISLLLFLVLAVTGALEMFVYVPVPERPPSRCARSPTSPPSAGCCATCTTGPGR